MDKTLKILPWMACVLAGCATEEVAQSTAAQEPTPVAEQAPVASLAGVTAQPPPPPPYIAQVNTLAAAKSVANINHAAFKQVVLDGIQAESIIVDDVRRSKTNDGYERVQVMVKNVTAAAIRTRYRFDWQDAHGVVVTDPDHAGWEKLTIAPGDVGVFTSIAPKKDCADFRLRMKSIQ